MFSTLVQALQDIEKLGSWCLNFDDPADHEEHSYLTPDETGRQSWYLGAEATYPISSIEVKCASDVRESAVLEVPAEYA